MWALAGAITCGTACTHQIQTAAHGSSRSGVATVMARQVQNAVDAGEGDLEARALRKRLAANAGDLDARMALARLYARQGFPDLALEHYRLAIGQFPDSARVALALAKTLREMGEPEQALNAVEAWLSQHPAGNWEMLSLQGILDDEQGRFVKASAAYRAALQLAPGQSTLHNNLGYNLLLQGKTEDAAAEFRRAIQIDPHSQIAHNNLGSALALQSHPESREALTEWQRSSDPAVAHNNLAAVLIEQGRYPEARAELQTALKLRNDFAPALANLKLLAEKDGEPVRLPVSAPAPTFWQRFAITWNNLVGAGNKTKPAPSNAKESAADPAGAPAQAPAQDAGDAAGISGQKGGKTN